MPKWRGGRKCVGYTVCVDRTESQVAVTISLKQFSHPEDGGCVFLRNGGTCNDYPEQKPKKEAIIYISGTADVVAAVQV